MKAIAFILALTLAGCAIPTQRHDPLMSIPTPNPSWP